MTDLDRHRLESSLSALRRDLDRLDHEILAALDPFLQRRTHLVSVLWTVKDALELPPIDDELEGATDAARLAGGIAPGKVALLRAVREATRPRIPWPGEDDVRPAEDDTVVSGEAR